jgi:hypothetical protein
MWSNYIIQDLELQWPATTKDQLRKLEQRTKREISDFWLKHIRAFSVLLIKVTHRICICECYIQYTISNWFMPFSSWENALCLTVKQRGLVTLWHSGLIFHRYSFRYRPWHRITWLKAFVIFLRSSRQIQGQCLHLPQLFPFSHFKLINNRIIQRSVYRLVPNKVIPDLHRLNGCVCVLFARIWMIKNRSRRLEH